MVHTVCRVPAVAQIVHPAVLALPPALLRRLVLVERLALADKRHARCAWLAIRAPQRLAML